MDRFYLHALGDYDYSRTARERGIKLRVAPACLGTCERHDKAVAWQAGSAICIPRWGMPSPGITSTTSAGTTACWPRARP